MEESQDKVGMSEDNQAGVNMTLHDVNADNEYSDR